jgi:hypothetical protein
MKSILRWAAIAFLGLVVGCAPNTDTSGCASGPSRVIIDSVRLECWTALSATECRGTIINGGNRSASSIRIHLDYRDSLHVVMPLLPALTPGSRSEFVAPPARYGSSFIYPDVVLVEWDRGRTSYPDAAVQFNGWVSVSDTGAIGEVINLGDRTADSVVVQVETRDGVQSVTTDPEYIYPSETRCPHQPSFALFRCAPGAAAGVAPRVTRITWRGGLFFPYAGPGRAGSLARPSASHR